MTTTTTAPAVSLDESDAALLEAIAVMPADLVALRERKIQLAEQRDVLNAEIEDIKAIFATRLAADGLQGYTFAGKVHARVSTVITNRLDSKRLKEKHPQIWKAFLKPTTSTRVTIN